MDWKLQKVALRRLQVLPSSEEGADPVRRLIFLSELAHLGYRLEDTSLYNDSLLNNYQKTTEVLREMKGGQVDYVPLFVGFPSKVPEGRGYLSDRILAFVGNALGSFTDGRRLENGLVVPEWLFELDAFGADPITQMQDKGLFKAALLRLRRRQPDESTQWTQLRVLSEPEVLSELKLFLERNLYAKSSIREHLKPDLLVLIEHFGIEELVFDRVIFKETRTYLSNYFWKRQSDQALKSLRLTPTDLLRLFASLTDSDVSLATKIRFPKLRRRRRRLVMEILEGAPELEADLQRYRRLWLALGRYLHPFDYRSAYPKTVAAFEALYEDSIITLDSAWKGFIGWAIWMLCSRSSDSVRAFSVGDYTVCSVNSQTPQTRSWKLSSRWPPLFP